MSTELREPLKDVAHEWCACGRISLPPAQWDVIQEQTRKWKKNLPHTPKRFKGCSGIDEDVEEAPTMPPGPQLNSPVSERAESAGVGPSGGEPDHPVPWHLRKDKETGLFLDLPGLKPGYMEWKTKVGLALKEYLRKHETFFADDFFNETKLVPFEGVHNSFAGICRAAEVAGWMARTPELRRHYPTRDGQAWGGKFYRVWKSLLYPDKEPQPQPRMHPGNRPVRVCSVHGCSNRLRPNNLSGICTPHRMLVPGHKRRELISDALRRQMREAQGEPLSPVVAQTFGEGSSNGRTAVSEAVDAGSGPAPSTSPVMGTGGFKNAAVTAAIEAAVDKRERERARGGKDKQKRAMLDKIKAQLAAKVNVTEIARRLGISRDTVYHWLKKDGVDMGRPSHQEAGRLGGQARWRNFYKAMEKKAKEVNKKMEYISNQRLARDIRRSDVTTAKYGGMLGFKPSKANGLLSWTKEEAAKITAELAKAKVINSKRSKMAKIRNVEPTKASEWLTRRKPDSGKKPEKTAGKEAPIGKWLKLQMEQAGVTYCLYEKEKGITIRRQRVVEEEEKYE